MSVFNFFKQIFQTSKKTATGKEDDPLTENPVAPADLTGEPKPETAILESPAQTDSREEPEAVAETAPSAPTGESAREAAEASAAVADGVEETSEDQTPPNESKEPAPAAQENGEAALESEPQGQAPDTNQPTEAKTDQAPKADLQPPKQLLKKVFFLGSGHEKLNHRIKDELKKLGFSYVDLSDSYTEISLDEITNSHRGVFFSIVTLSGDEFIYDKNGKPAQAQLGAKQDVVFKLGYLIGKYGKMNCYVLFKEQKSFALPTSLLHGTFTVLDDDARWRDILRHRLTGSGYSL